MPDAGCWILDTGCWMPEDHKTARLINQDWKFSEVFTLNGF
jgi:hypothetical protein